ncbi:MAG: ABC transporter substrate-binding protein, partial [Alphaproteobacteria bacterium]|nr:ABC transporter substrate-binding protein [Alphaproteobacteria bacterium]
MLIPNILKSFKTLTLNLFTILSACILFTACSETSKPKVGVIQTSDHEALDATRLGVMDDLRSKGLIPDQDIIFKWESAQGNPATASQIAQKFIGQKYDVIVTIGTLASQSTLQAVKGSSIPVIYASVTDPKNAKLTGNISGVSNFIEPKIQFETFQKILPHLKKIGVIYSPGEQNSVVLNELMEKVGKELGLEVVFAPASKTSDVYAAAMSLVGKADALFVNNDNVALAAFDAVLKVGKENKVPVFVSDTDLVAK